MKRALFAVPLLILTAACGGSGVSVTLPDDQPAIDGDIIEIGRSIPIAPDDPNTIWVKETPDAPCGIVFVVDESTPIGQRRADGSASRRSFSDLAVSQRVRVWADAVAESCPAQARAEAIEILP